MESAGEWAERSFGNVQLGDQRRTQRAVQMAEAMAGYPDGGLGRQMQGWGAQKAAYRLLDEESVSHAKLSEAHWHQTRQTERTEGKTHLLVQDITEVDYSHHETEGLGPIGNHQGQGFEVHSTLLVEADVGEVVGLAHQMVWTRDAEAHQKQESRTQRHQRENRQSQVWGKAVEAIGVLPLGSRWVYVGDRESDIFTYFTTIQAQGAHFCIRASQNWRVVSETEARYVLGTGSPSDEFPTGALVGWERGDARRQLAGTASTTPHLSQTRACPPIPVGGTNVGTAPAHDPCRARMALADRCPCYHCRGCRRTPLVVHTPLVD
jgi:hypothetical protein